MFHCIIEGNRLVGTLKRASESKGLPRELGHRTHRNIITAIRFPEVAG